MQLPHFSMNTCCARRVYKDRSEYWKRQTHLPPVHRPTSLIYIRQEHHRSRGNVYNSLRGGALLTSGDSLLAYHSAPPLDAIYKLKQKVRPLRPKRNWYFRLAKTQCVYTKLLFTTKWYQKQKRDRKSTMKHTHKLQ